MISPNLIKDSYDWQKRSLLVRQRSEMEEMSFSNREWKKRFKTFAKFTAQRNLFSQASHLAQNRRTNQGHTRFMSFSVQNFGCNMRKGKSRGDDSRT